jgi:hypothetical protein
LKKIVIALFLALIFAFSLAGCGGGGGGSSDGDGSTGGGGNGGGLSGTSWKYVFYLEYSRPGDYVRETSILSFTSNSAGKLTVDTDAVTLGKPFTSSKTDIFTYTFDGSTVYITMQKNNVTEKAVYNPTYIYFTNHKYDKQ